jgi:hypothetical protein
MATEIRDHVGALIETVPNDIESAVLTKNDSDEGPFVSSIYTDDDGEYVFAELRDPITGNLILQIKAVDSSPECCAIRPGTLGYQMCWLPAGHAGDHKSQDGETY